MPSWTSRGELLERRTRFSLIAWIVLLPLVGLSLMGLAVRLLWVHPTGQSLVVTLGQALWLSVVGLTIAIGLPAVAIKELKRRQAVASGSSVPSYGAPREGASR
jgi:hypothetical protein